MKTLDELLEEIGVMDSWDNQVSEHLEGWYAVTNSEGIIAYFSDEKMALAFRLTYINFILNGNEIHAKSV